MSDSNWFENYDRLSEDQKKILFREMGKFDEYGNAVHQEANLIEIGKRFDALAEFAARYLNEEVSDSFDQVTVNKNIKELNKKVRKFKKEAEKVQKHQERLTALYDDIGRIFDRYFGIGEKNLQESATDEIRSLVRETVKQVLREDVEFDVKKMRKLRNENNFIDHMVRNAAERRGENHKRPSRETLKLVFKDYVVGDRSMERAYRSMR